MARLTTTTAKTAKRNLLPYTMTAMAVVLLSAFLVSEAAAQKAPGPGPVNPGGAQADIITDAIDYCAWMAEDDIAAEEALAADGWTIDYSEANGTYVWEINAYKIYDDGTDAYIFALIETYPTGRITYCSYDANTLPAIPDLARISQEYDVAGEMDDYGDGLVYGAWEEITDDAFYFVLANTDVDYFFLQMTVVSAGGFADAGSGGSGK